MSLSDKNLLDFTQRFFYLELFHKECCGDMPWPKIVNSASVAKRLLSKILSRNDIVYMLRPHSDVEPLNVGVLSAVIDGEIAGNNLSKWFLLNKKFEKVSVLDFNCDVKSFFEVNSSCDLGAV